MRIEEIKVFTFAELSEDAKETAREWYKNNILNVDFSIESEDITDSMKEKCKELGLQLEGKNSVQWQLAHVQSDYVGIDFDGINSEVLDVLIQNSLNKKDLKWYNFLEKHFTNFFYISAKGSYHHYYGQQNEVLIDLDMNDSNGKIYALAERLQETLEKSVNEYVRDARRQLQRMGYQEIEYYYSNECVDENMIANNYEFKENGSKFE